MAERGAVTEADILEWLRVCFDPELPVNIVDLGLVNGIDVAPDEQAPGVESRYHVAVTLTMRAQNEEREAILLGQVSNRLAGIPAISRADVRISWEPAWSPERMSAAARRQLGLNTTATSDLIQIRI